MFSTLGMGHTKLAKELHVFGRFFGMKGKKVVPHHPLAIMARGNKVQCSMGGHKVVSLRELDARDVISHLCASYLSLFHRC